MLVRTAIILAAGLSTRLRPIIGNMPKQLLRINNVPLIAFPIASLLKNGIKHFYVVVNTMNKDYISEILEYMGVSYDLILNKKPERANGYSALLALERVDDEYVMLSMSDHIFSPNIPPKLLNAREADIIIGADTKPAFISVFEATKLLVDENNNVKDIGKNIANYNCIDIGLFVMKKSVVKTYKEFCNRNFVVELASLIKHSINVGRNVIAVDVQGLPWLDIDTEEDLHKVRGIANNFINQLINDLLDYLRIFIEEETTLQVE